MNKEQSFSPMRWEGNALLLIDQLKLPGEELWIRCESADAVADAIRNMNVRGAPAIGCAAAFGVVLAAQKGATAHGSTADLRASLSPVLDLLADTRPTAVNLFWALERMREAALAERSDPHTLAEHLEKTALAIFEEDLELCRRIGEHGAELIPDRATVLTHCNAGALATAGHGTALGVLRTAKAQGKELRVLADETRPYLQGARLTAWELLRDGFDVTVIPDVAAAFLLQRGEVTCCIVGADRVAANGDIANKVGTYGVALAADAAGVPFYVAAPYSTLDFDTATGADIPIEERAGDEVLSIAGHSIAPGGVQARYPAFDITPAKLVSAIITDAGVARPPYSTSLAAFRKR